MEAVIRSCPEIHVLASSRERLDVIGERIFRIPPLSLPAPGANGTLATSEAVQLFLERARESSIDFAFTSKNAEVIASICRQLDGMPLALELAAARPRSFSVLDIETRLRDRFRLLTRGSRTAAARQRTLAATVQWSYDLLDEPERWVLRRLSVFRGGWELETAESLCAMAIANQRLEVDIIDILSSLVDKSLIYTETTPHESIRYRILETIRGYAAERLEAMGENEVEAVRTAHAQAMLGVVGTAAPHLLGPNQSKLARSSRARAREPAPRRPRSPWSTIRSPTRLSGWPTVCAAVLGHEGLLPRGHNSARVHPRQRSAQEGEPRTSKSAGGIGCAEPLRAQGRVDTPRRRPLLGPETRRHTGARRRSLRDGLDRIRTQATQRPGSAWRLMASPPPRRLRISTQGLRPRAPSLASSDVPTRRHAGVLTSSGRSSAVTAVENVDRVSSTWCRLAIDELELGDQQAAKAHLDRVLEMSAQIGNDGLLPFVWAALGLCAMLDADPILARTRFGECLANAMRIDDRRVIAYAAFGLAYCAAVGGHGRRGQALRDRGPAARGVRRKA